MTGWENDRAAILAALSDPAPGDIAQAVADGITEFNRLLAQRVKKDGRRWRIKNIPWPENELERIVQELVLQAWADQAGAPITAKMENVTRRFTPK